MSRRLLREQIDQAVDNAWLAPQASSSLIADSVWGLLRAHGRHVALGPGDTTPLDCGICYRDDTDPEKVVITYLAECDNHGRY